MEVITDSQPEEIVWEDSSGKQWWRQRTNLEKKLVIILTVAGVIVLGCLLYAAIRPPSSSKSCDTTECLVAASQILDIIDSNIDPCENFFKFACGTFHPYSLEEKIQQELQDILEKPINGDDHFLINSQKKFFQACMNETAVESTSLDIFRDTLKDINDWPVVLGHKWKERQFEWTGMITKLRQKGYLYSMILNVLEMFDPDNPSNLIVEIALPNIPNIKDEHKDLYVDYMADVAELFGADSNRASVEMEKVLDFKEKLRKIRENQWERARGNETRNDTRLTLQKFTEYYDDDTDWLNFINSLLTPEAKVSAGDYILIPDSESMEDFITLMYKTSKRTQANYIIWSVIEELIPILSKDLKQMYENYNCLTDPTSKTKSRFDLCQSFMYQSYNPLPSDILYARKKLPLEQIQPIESIADDIKFKLEEFIMENSWTNEEDEIKLTDIFSNVSYVIGAQEDYFDDGIFENFDSGKNKISEGHFLTVFLNRRKQQTDTYYSIMHTADANNLFKWILSDFVTYTDPIYVMNENKLILPVGLLQGINYNPEKPMYLNYGALGAQIGGEFVLGLIVNDDWSKDTMKSFENQTKCLSKELGLEHDDREVITILKIVKEFVGIKVARNAYQAWIEKNGKESDLIGVNYTPNQLFWISALISRCYYKRENCNDSTGNAFYQNSIFIRTNPDFVEDFNCATDSDVNPIQKCLNL